MNKNYENISIPDNIDDFIDIGVKRAVDLKNIKRKKLIRRNLGITAASLIIVLTIGFSNPALAAKIPIVGNVFQAIEKNIYFPSNYSEYSTSVNETAYSNGVGVTLSDILCDGQSLYVTYIVESEKPFKYTSWGEAPLTMNQLITSEEYNKVDFSNKQLDNTGIAGLEGKFIDDNTFVGMEKYKLSSLKISIPDEFIFQVKYISFQTDSVENDEKRDVKSGTWAFKIPVKVNKDIKRVVNLDNIGNDSVNLNSLSITPFDMIFSLTYNKGKWSDYEVSIYDENREELNFSDSSIDEDNKTENIIFKAPSNESKNIRVIINKPILEKGETITESKGQSETSYKEIGKELIFDEIINIK
ncbi:MULTISPECIES: DUF4179 domain-containing protein [Clostridium]|uniref:DUF4179 domain-containing protein n=1 Tax=Clostridium aquiflavi TaxID=3073603 RepID=A0ABU1EF36_9CLOT|nr:MULTISPECIES: DUF4179 domain-containing protein [unclassified Clostridium]MDR5586793.1 DUF4179 domain-containing protein [Clostridium sp. 5N-1]NFG62641.1 DUF4179 domain-containing protein [Clostridium botulinum]NFQ09997.1 DUF4179 domain-containing protein [Clostridium botulinum]